MRAMAACVAATIAGIGGHVDDSKPDAKLLKAFGEVDILQAYVMAAAEIVAGEDDRSPRPAASVLLHQGRVELSATASPLLKWSTDVPQDHDMESARAMPKILHALREIALSPTPVQGSELLMPDMVIQKVTEGVIEANFVTEASTKHNESSDTENCANPLEVTAAIPINGTTQNCNGEPEAYHAVSESAAENRDIVECMGTDVIASHESHGSKDINASVAAPSNAQDHGDASTETRKGSEVNLTGEPMIGVRENCDASEVIEMLLDEGEVRIGTSNMTSSESEAKVKISSTNRATNRDAVGGVHKATTISNSFSFTGLNHVALCVENLERSLDFYCGLLGLQTNLDRPELPYRGAWLCLGAEGIHIMEVPNPDPVNGRPAHGGFDRHACLNCKNVEGVRLALEKAGIPYQPSIVPSLFTRDPDGNGLEFIEVNS